MFEITHAPEPTLLPVRPGTISERDKAALSEAGIIVIEHENPSELRLIRPNAEIDSSAMLTCAMEALTLQDNYSSGKAQREQFTKLLAKVLTERAGT